MSDKILEIKKASAADSWLLAALNKQLIEDEGSDNPMDFDRLEERMRNFLFGDYTAYLFIEEEKTVGYALAKTACSPVYLRQFFICREYRRQHYGKAAFKALTTMLGYDIELEVLPWNERGMRFWKSVGFEARSVIMRYKKGDSQ